MVNSKAVSSDFQMVDLMAGWKVCEMAASKEVWLAALTAVSKVFR